MDILARGNPVGRAGVTALLVLAALPTVLLAAVPPEEDGGALRGRGEAPAVVEFAPTADKGEPAPASAPASPRANQP